MPQNSLVLLGRVWEFLEGLEGDLLLLRNGEGDAEKENDGSERGDREKATCPRKTHDDATIELANAREVKTMSDDGNEENGEHDESE